MLSDFFHQVCLQVVSWQISAKWSEGALGQVAVGIMQVEIGDSGCLCGLALPRLMPPIFMQVCVIEIIDEKMRHFLWDTPLLMICQTVYTADFMFC